MLNSSLTFQPHLVLVLNGFHISLVEKAKQTKNCEILLQSRAPLNDANISQQFGINTLLIHQNSTRYNFISCFIIAAVPKLFEWTFTFTHKLSFYTKKTEKFSCWTCLFILWILITSYHKEHHLFFFASLSKIRPSCYLHIIWLSA